MTEALALMWRDGECTDGISGIHDQVLTTAITDSGTYTGSDDDNLSDNRDFERIHRRIGHFSCECDPIYHITIDAALLAGSGDRFGSLAMTGANVAGIRKNLSWNVLPYDVSAAGQTIDLPQRNRNQ